MPAPIVWEAGASGPRTVAQGEGYAVQVLKVVGGYNVRLLYRPSLVLETTHHETAEAARAAAAATLTAQGLALPPL
jgi:hypothetical protein